MCDDSNLWEWEQGLMERIAGSWNCLCPMGSVLTTAPDGCPLELNVRHGWFRRTPTRYMIVVAAPFSSHSLATRDTVTGHEHIWRSHGHEMVVKPLSERDRGVVCLACMQGERIHGGGTVCAKCLDIASCNFVRDQREGMVHVLATTPVVAGGPAKI